MASEDSNFRSKKFVAFLVAEASWKVLAGLVLFWGKDAIPGQVFWILFSIIMVAGFNEVGYILGQASLDKYIHALRTVANSGGTVSMPALKGLEVQSATPPATSAEKQPKPGKPSKQDV